MELKFTGRRWHDDQTGTVTFPAWASSVRVPCRITDEALIYLFGAVATHTGLIEAFDRNMAVIQAAAGWKYEAGCDPLQIILVSGDFPDKTPAPPPQSETLSPDEIAKRMKKFRGAYHGPAAARAAADVLAARAGGGAGEDGVLPTLSEADDETVRSGVDSVAALETSDAG